MAEVYAQEGPLREIRAAVTPVVRPSRGRPTEGRDKREASRDARTPQKRSSQEDLRGDSTPTNPNDFGDRARELVEDLRRQRIARSFERKASAGSEGTPIGANAIERRADVFEVGLRNQLVEYLAQHKPRSEGRLLASETQRELRAGLDRDFRALARRVRGRQTLAQAQAEQAYREVAESRPDGSLSLLR